VCVCERERQAASNQTNPFIGRLRSIWTSLPFSQPDSQQIFCNCHSRERKRPQDHDDAKIPCCSCSCSTSTLPRPRNSRFHTR
jgi:hypothetical protein